MAKFYTKQAFIDYAKQQIIENKDIIKAWNIAIPIAEKFDGKVINKRLTTAIDNELSKVFKHSYSTVETFTTYFRLNLTVRDNDSYRVSEYSCNYTEYQDSTYCQGITDNRLEYSKLYPAIMKSIHELEETNKKLDYEANNIDEIEKQFRHINAQIESFNKQTSYYLHDLYKFH